MSTLESALLKLGIVDNVNELDLSENYLKNIASIYSSTETNKYGFARESNDGGSFYYSQTCFLRDKLGGTAYETDDILSTQITRDYNITKNVSLTDLFIKRIINLPNMNNVLATDEMKAERINKIKELVYNYGAATVSFYYLSQYHNVDTNAFYYDRNLGSNHALSIVGWDDNYSKTNFLSSLQPSMNGAFIVKNSWGTSSKNDGYLYVSYDMVNYLIRINAFADLDLTSSYDNMYEYDEMGNNCNMSINSNIVYYANKFKLKDMKESLKSISTYIDAPNSCIKVYVSETGDFEDLQEVEIKNAGPKYSSGYYIEDAGYAVLDLTSPKTIDNEEFIVCISLSNNNSQNLIPIERQTMSEVPYIDIEPNQSYCSNSLETMKNGSATDLSSILTCGNVCIKAFTDSYQHK